MCFCFPSALIWSKREVFVTENNYRSLRTLSRVIVFENWCTVPRCGQVKTEVLWKSQLTSCSKRQSKQFCQYIVFVLFTMISNLIAYRCKAKYFLIEASSRARELICTVYQGGRTRGFWAGAGSPNKFDGGGEKFGYYMVTTNFWPSILL